MDNNQIQVAEESKTEWQLTRPVPVGVKMTTKIDAAILQSLANGGYVETSCVAAGITKRTFYNWLEKAEEDEDSVYAEFADLVEKARAQAELANIAIIKAAAVENWQAAAWLLERVYPERYGNRNRTTLDGGLVIGHTSAALIAAMRDGVNDTNE